MTTAAALRPQLATPALAVLAVHGVSATYSGIPALQRVDLSFAPGQIHGVVGENGAGKSTLMNILFGLRQPDQGWISLDGQRVRLRSPRDAQQHGIGMVHQHFAVVPTLSAADNIILALGQGLGLKRSNRAALLIRIQALATQLGWTLDMSGPMGAATVGQQQRLEILKALAMGGRILILDEPTAVLAPQEVDDLLAALSVLASAGRTILFITHKLSEVERCCDTVAILRQSRLVHSGPRQDISASAMAEKMVGTAPAALPPRVPAEPGAPVLSVQGVRLLPHSAPITLTVRRGEITAIAGVDGNGQNPLIAAILRHQHAPMPGIALDAKRIAVIPEDRLRHAVIADMTVMDNLLFRDRARAPWSSRWGWLHRRRWQQRAAELIQEFSIRTPSAQVRIGQLSGGNQQKVVIARELAEPADLVIAVNPTRGLDLAATHFVFERLLAARAAGAGVLLVHFDLDELLRIADRVLVMHNSTLTPTAWPLTTRAELGQLMAGVAENVA